MNKIKKSEQLIHLISQKKAEKITLYHMNKNSFICDYFLIVSCNNNIHLKAVTETIKDYYKELGDPLKINGENKSGWIIADEGELMIHIVTNELREHYQLDNFYKDESIVYHY